MRILLAEDDQTLGQGIVDGLVYQGYAVDWMEDGQKTYQALQTQNFDAVILDIGLPGCDGLSIVQRIRQQKNRTPILLLTARDAIDDRVKGLDIGADDYMTKPFDFSELIARLRALVRRTVDRAIPEIRVGDVVLDPAARTVYQSDELVKLSRREFTLLECLLANAGAVVSKSKLFEAIYAWHDEVDSNVLEVHIHHLRRKFGSDFIKTVRGVGYIIQNPEK